MTGPRETMEMDEQPDQPFEATTITDKPAPGSAYVTFLLLVFGSTLTAMVLLAAHNYARRPDIAYWLWGASVLVTALAGVVLDAAFRTAYHLRGRELEMKSGLFKRTLNLTRVSGISRRATIWRVLGWGFRSRGYANRFVNGVRLDTDRETIYLSPTNPQLFMEHVRHHRFGKPEMVVNNN